MKRSVCCAVAYLIDMAGQVHLSTQAEGERVRHLQAFDAASAATLKKYVAGAEAAAAEISAAQAAAAESAAACDMMCARADAAEAQLADSRSHAEVFSLELAAMEHQVADMQAQVCMLEVSCYLIQT